MVFGVQSMSVPGTTRVQGVKPEDGSAPQPLAATAARQTHASLITPRSSALDTRPPAGLVWSRQARHCSGRIAPAAVANQARSGSRAVTCHGAPPPSSPGRTPGEAGGQALGLRHPISDTGGGPPDDTNNRGRRPVTSRCTHAAQLADLDASSWADLLAPRVVKAIALGAAAASTAARPCPGRREHGRCVEGCLG